MSLASMFMACSSGSDVITLTGTTGSPRYTSENTFGGPNARPGWEFRTDGTLYQMYANSTNTQYIDTTQWDSEKPPTADFWIRATADTGDSPTTGTLNTWQKVSGGSSSNRSWFWNDDLGGQGTIGAVKIEISTASDGNPIVATGYYGGNADSA